MAITKLGNTKSTSRAINYAEKRATVKDGLNCDVEYAKSSFKHLRALYGKENGVQGHTIIQSFKPGEVTEQQCNELGLQLAREIAPDYQVAVYTHNDKEHIHNHIIINSVNIDTGKKYQSNKAQRELVKQKNDEICREHGLSVPVKTSNLRYTQAERAILEKGQSSWKDELRKAINVVKSRNSDFESFQSDLASFGIETKKRGSTVSYLHPEREKWVRGKTLGADYELGGIENEFRRFNQSREITSEWRELKQDTEKRRNRRIEQEDRLIAEKDERRRLREEREREEIEKSKYTSTKSRYRNRDTGFEME